MTTDATDKTVITYDYPDWANKTIVNRLKTSVAINSHGEIILKKEYETTLDASGQASDELPTPDSTGDLAWLWDIGQPDGTEPEVSISYSASSQDIAVIIAAEQSSTTPSEVAVLIENKMDLVTPAPVAGDIHVDDGTGQAAASGSTVASFDPVGSAAAAQAAAIAASVAKAGDTMTGSLFMDTADIELVQTGQTARGVINFNSYINGWVGLWGIRTNVTPTSTNAAVAIDAFNGSVKINAPTTKTVSLAVNNVNKIRMSDNYIALFGATPTDGANVIVVKDVTVAPTVAPTGAGILFSQGGALKWLGSGGTITTIAPA